MKPTTQKRETVSAEVKKYMQENGQDMAESHIEAWKDRYLFIGLKQLKTDLYANHDPSVEIGEVELALDRELNDKESAYVVNQFNKAVIKIRS